jgi:hypothetical protein
MGALFCFLGTRLSAAIPNCEPSQFTAGDTVVWDRSFADYPATDGWTLKYAFRGVGKIDVDAQPNGTGYSVLIDSTTSNVAPGLYEWKAFVERGDSPIERHTLAQGRVNIGAELSGISNTSRQAHAERALVLCETMLEQLLASPIETYTIEQQTTVRRKISEMYSLRAKYKAELNSLKNRGRPRSYAVYVGRG